jgi:phospho-N-acetylmuramoyl-pentapeptide-transferase
VIYHLLNWWFQAQPYAYQNAMFRATLAMLTGFAVAVIIGPAVIRTLKRLKIGDVPEFYNEDANRLMQMKSQTPTMGGVIILTGIFIGTLLWAKFNNYYVVIGLFTLLWLGGLGLVDDYLKLTSARRGTGRDGLKTWEKLVFQIGLGVMLAIFIYRHGQDAVGTLQGLYSQMVLPFSKHPLQLEIWLFSVITVLVITGTSNAVNLTDGMDGLAAGCMGIVGFVFMAVSYVTGMDAWASYLLLPYIPDTEELAVMCGALVGSCLGFMWYNCHPAQVFMGDTGSLAMGGFIGYVAIVTRQELLLFIVGGVFVIEALSVIMQVSYFKATGGKRIFKMSPIHHHFHLKGWPETKVVVRFWLLSMIFAILAMVAIKLR